MALCRASAARSREGMQADDWRKEVTRKLRRIQDRVRKPSCKPGSTASDGKISICWALERGEAWEEVCISCFFAGLAGDERADEET